MRYGGCNDINVGYIGRHKRPIRIIIRKLQIVSVDLKQTYVEVLVVGAEVEGGEPLCICNGRTHSVETQAGHHRRKTTSSPGRCWRFARFVDILGVLAEVEVGESFCVCNGRTHPVETQAGHHRGEASSSPCSR